MGVTTLHTKSTSPRLPASGRAVPTIGSCFRMRLVRLEGIVWAMLRPDLEPDAGSSSKVLSQVTLALDLTPSVVNDCIPGCTRRQWRVCTVLHAATWSRPADCLRQSHKLCRKGWLFAASREHVCQVSPSAAFMRPSVPVSALKRGFPSAASTETMLLGRP